MARPRSSRRLTGIDTDRLKEEKARGITVDLGFAYKPTADGSVLGFVDVPGHERLVRNMLAGATGIDHVLLVVAADDGPMPQTREHLAILDLLGLARGAVVLTKSDLVSAARLAEVRRRDRALLRRPAWPTRRCSRCPTSPAQGMAALAQHLLQAQRTQAPARDDGHFRLAVDRCFSLAGIGTVVTGTAVSGRVAVGDRVLVSPRSCRCACAACMRRTASRQQGRAGQRLALNLAATGWRRATSRAATGSSPSRRMPATRRIDARMRLLRERSTRLAHWTPVHLHLGACDVGARVVLLEGPALAPGGSALVQLELDREIAAWHGDRFILRDQSATRTLGGGSVLDPFRQRHPAPQAAAPGRPGGAGAARARKTRCGAAGARAARRRGLHALRRACNLQPARRQALLAGRAAPRRADAGAPRSLCAGPDSTARRAPDRGAGRSPPAAPRQPRHRRSRCCSARPRAKPRAPVFGHVLRRTDRRRHACSAPGPICAWRATRCRCSPTSRSCGNACAPGWTKAASTRPSSPTCSRATARCTAGRGDAPA